MKSRWFILILLVGAAAIGMVTPLKKASSITTGSIEPPANRANDWLLAQTPKVRAEKLGRVAGEGCKGVQAFYQGKSVFNLDPQVSPKAFGLWSISCANGRSYSVLVNPEGSSKIMSCELLKAVHGGTCFKKYN